MDAGLPLGELMRRRPYMWPPRSRDNPGSIRCRDAPLRAGKRMVAPMTALKVGKAVPSGSGCWGPPCGSYSKKKLVAPVAIQKGG
jgi:hypothetical protein